MQIWNIRENLCCQVLFGSEEFKNNQQPLGIATYTLKNFWPFGETHTTAMETRTVAKTRFIADSFPAAGENRR